MVQTNPHFETILVRRKRWEPKQPGDLRARDRQLFPPATTQGLLDRAIAVLWPWKRVEYPGKWRLLGWLLAMPNLGSAAAYRKIPLPPLRARILSARLRAKASEIVAMADEIDAAYPDRDSKVKAVRKSVVVAPPPD